MKNKLLVILGAMGVLSFLFPIGSVMADDRNPTWINGFPYVLRERGEKSYLEVHLPLNYDGGFGESIYIDYQYPLDENGILVVPDEEEFHGTIYPIRAIDIGSIRDQREAKGVKLGKNMKYLRHGNLTNLPKAKIVDLGQVEWTDADCISNMPLLETLTINVPLKKCGSGLCNLGLKEFEFEDWLNFTDCEIPEELINEDYIICTDYNTLLLCGWPNIKKLDLSNLSGIPQFNTFMDFPSVEKVLMPECLRWSGYGIYNLPSLKEIWLSNEYDYYSSFYACCYDVFEVPNLEVVYSPCAVPPDYNYNGGPIQEETLEPPVYTFGYNSINTEKCIVYVPEGCVESYRNSRSWKEFRNILEYDFENNVPLSGIGDIPAEESGSVRYYDAQGMEIRDISGYKGLYMEVNPGAGKISTRVRVK